MHRPMWHNTYGVVSLFLIIVQVDLLLTHAQREKKTAQKMICYFVSKSQKRKKKNVQETDSNFKVNTIFSFSSFGLYLCFSNPLENFWWYSREHSSGFVVAKNLKDSWKYSRTTHSLPSVASSMQEEQDLSAKVALCLWRRWHVATQHIHAQNIEQPGASLARLVVMARPG